MSKKRYLPDNCIPIPTYVDLDSFGDEFNAGAYDFLAVIGNQGLGKSRAFSERLPEEGRCLVGGGRSTPFQVYQQLFENRDLPVIVDDADDLWADPKARPMMKQLCETNPNRGPRLISYRSREIERLGIPTKFLTSSKIVVVCNDWPKGFGAVADRGNMLYFNPDVYEVHEHIRQAKWFGDEQVVAFMESYLHLITEPSMRYYLHAHNMRQAGRADWREKTMLMIQPDKQRAMEIAVVASLLRDESLSPPERVRRFNQATGRSQAEFYRTAGEVKQAQGLGKGERNAENLRKPKAETPVPPSVNVSDEPNSVLEALGYIGGDDDARTPLSNYQDSTASTSLQSGQGG
jgi:hypothetical protein